MDRRQKKTRNSIFAAFTDLLNEKNYNQITVGEIIERADVGRATFYAHFETKDFLLKEICEELFCHIFDSDTGVDIAHEHIFSCDAPDSVFLHLFQHIKKNDNNITSLLSCRNNDLFLQYFKENLIKLINKANLINEENIRNLPYDFIVNHTAATFIETIKWWLEHQMDESPETITEYFLSVIQQ